MWERFAQVALGAFAPLLGVAIRTSRRTRLIQRAEKYDELAAKLESKNPTAAAQLRVLVEDVVAVLVMSEQRSISRRFDPTALLSFIFFLTPAAIGAWAFYRWPWHWWSVAVLGVSAFYALLMFTAFLNSVWKPHEDVTLPSAARAPDLEALPGEGARLESLPTLRQDEAI